METGTGKTYVYLRTIFELSKRYGFKKFVIVVPERRHPRGRAEEHPDHGRPLPGALQQAASSTSSTTRSASTGCASSPPRTRCRSWSSTSRLSSRTFAGRASKSNVIYKESDKLSGRQPIEFVQAARPIVIIDEPQSVDSTEKSQDAIKELNPLCTLRYSATHRNPVQPRLPARSRFAHSS